MKLTDTIPDADVLVALELEELGLRILPVCAHWQANRNFTGHLTVQNFSNAAMQPPSPVSMGAYPQNRSAEIQLALREAWAWLEGQGLLIRDPNFMEPNAVRMLSRKAEKLARDPNLRRVFMSRPLPKNLLNPRIRDDVWSLYHRGKYDTAVFEAMKAVEVAVRDAAGLAASDIGKDLMRKAFDVKSGVLRNPAAEPGERQARSDLFAGAMGSYKNPHSHRNVTLDDPDEAAEIVMLANHLLRIIDARVAAKVGP